MPLDGGEPARSIGTDLRQRDHRVGALRHRSEPLADAENDTGPRRERVDTASRCSVRPATDTTHPRLSARRSRRRRRDARCWCIAPAAVCPEPAQRNNRSGRRGSVSVREFGVLPLAGSKHERPEVGPTILIPPRRGTAATTSMAWPSACYRASGRAGLAAGSNSISSGKSREQQQLLTLWCPATCLLRRQTRCPCETGAG